MFDAYAHIAALTAPQYKDVDGRVYTGRLIGADTWLGMQATMRSPMRPDGTVDRHALERAMRAIVRAFFPAPWWKRLWPWAKTVEHLLWQLPPMIRMRAIWDFMQSQASAMGVLTTPLPGISLINGKLPGASRPGIPISGMSRDSTKNSQDSITTGDAAGAAQDVLAVGAA